MAELTQRLAGGPIESDAGGMVSALGERVTRAAEAGRGSRGGRAGAARIAALRRGTKHDGRTALDVIGNRGAIHVDAVTYEPARAGVGERQVDAFTEVGPASAGSPHARDNEADYSGW